MESIHFKLFAVLSSIQIIRAQNTNLVDSESNITSTILTNYDKNTRVGNCTVQIRLSLNQIVNIDEKLQSMTTSSIIEIIWTDQRLAYSSVSGITQVLLPANLLWLPDLYVTNTADTNGFFPVYSQNLARVSSTGLVNLKS